MKLLVYCPGLGARERTFTGMYVRDKWTSRQRSGLSPERVVQRVVADGYFSALTKGFIKSTSDTGAAPPINGSRTDWRRSSACGRGIAWPRTIRFAGEGRSGRSPVPRYGRDCEEPGSKWSTGWMAVSGLAFGAIISAYARARRRRGFPQPPASRRCGKPQK